MNAQLRVPGTEGLVVERVVRRYPLEPGLSITLTPSPRSASWRVAVERDTPPGDEPAYGAAALTHLLRYQEVPAVDRFHLVRHLATPEASGERPLDDDGQVVVVGERVVVSRVRSVRDIPYTVPVTLAQLAAVDFLGVPDTHGLLVWTTPTGYEAPIAVATRYLPRAVDGRTALLRLLARGPGTEPAEAPSLTARMGRIVAALHVALATRTSVLAEPVRLATPAELAGWHRRVRATVDEAARLPVAEPYARPGQDADLIEACAGSDVVLQRAHGDLHISRILRWPGGLAITGFGGEPDDPWLGLPQPPARDLARLLRGLDHVALEADEIAGTTVCTTEWLPGARHRLVSAYRTELAVAGRPELFDERLLRAFEAEDAARYAVEAFRPAAAATSSSPIEQIVLPDAPSPDEPAPRSPS